MDHLTLADITENALEELRKSVQACQQEIDEARERMRKLADVVESMEAKKEELLKDLHWRQLMAEAEAVDCADQSSDKADGVVCLRQEVADRIQLAVKKFKDSLVEPADYAEDCADNSGGEPVPYCDTDDYADLTALDAAVGELIDEVREQVERSSSMCASAPRRRNGEMSSAASSRNGSLTSRTLTAPVSPDGRVEQVEDAVRTKDRHRAMLKLLLVSLHVGRIEELCGFETIPDRANVPSDAADDIKEEVSTAWQLLLHESKALTPEEQAEWVGIVANFLGAPFDSTTPQ